MLLWRGTTCRAGVLTTGDWAALVTIAADLVARSSVLCLQQLNTMLASTAGRNHQAFEHVTSSQLKVEQRATIRRAATVYDSDTGVPCGTLTSASSA